MEELGLLGVFSAGLLASTLLPGGSEVVVALALQDPAAAPGSIWVAATLGNLAGAMISWGMGRAARAWKRPEKLGRPRIRRAVESVQRHGAPVLILSWLPVVGDPLCLAAGWLGIRAVPALLWIGLGKGLRYWALIGLLSAGGLTP